MFSFLSRGKATDAGLSREFPYILGLKFVARSRAEQREYEALEELVRRSDLPGIIFDKCETGTGEVSLWFHTSDAKRAFKSLSELPEIAERMSSLQAAWADRKKLKFSILWPKGAQAPAGLG